MQNEEDNGFVQILFHINQKIKQLAVDESISPREKAALIFSSAISALQNIKFKHAKNAIFIPSRFKITTGSGAEVLEETSCFCYSCEAEPNASVVHQKAYVSFILYYLLVTMQKAVPKEGMGALLNRLKGLKDVHHVKLKDQYKNHNCISDSLETEITDKIELNRSIQEGTYDTMLDLIKTHYKIDIKSKLHSSFLAELLVNIDKKPTSLWQTISILSKKPLFDILAFREYLIAAPLDTNGLTLSQSNELYLFNNLYYFLLGSGFNNSYYFPTVISTSKEINESTSSPGTLIVATDKPLTEPELHFFSTLSNIVWTQIAQLDIEGLEKKTLINSLKAAISQVMSRNLSHNIGSHVLANLTSGSYLKSLVGHHNEDGYIHIANLNSYLRTRMDFLADISTGTAVVENVKDLREDVTLPFQKIDLLQQHISGSDKKVNIRLPKAGILAAFPNDNLGVQALYVILENVIRNSAKHGRADKVVIQLDVNSEKDDNYIEVIIYDSKDKKTKQNLDELIQRQQERINKPILENGMLRKGSWGVLEMKIAAAYLRKQPVETVDEPQPLPFLTAQPVDQEYLGYKFYLLKPKRLLVVTEGNNISLAQQKQLAPYGINVIPPDEIDESQDTYPHEIVVLSENDEHKIQKKRRRFSPRVVSVPAAELRQLLGRPPKEMLSKAWQLWQLILEAKGASAKVTLSDDKSPAPEQTTKTLTIGKAKSDRYQQAEFVYHCDHFHEGLDYFEPYNSLSPIKSLIEELKHSDSIELQCQFLEAIHYKVAVVDERVQSYALRDYDGALNKGHTKNLDILNSCGIVIPGKSINLNANDFSNVEEQELRDWMVRELRRCDFLVLHIGVIEKLERMEQASDEGKKKVLKEFLDDLSKVPGKRGRLIITSGRGQPETLPRGTRFIHYSNIAQYVIEKTSKFHFLQLLMSAREIN